VRVVASGRGGGVGGGVTQRRWVGYLTGWSCGGQGCGDDGMRKF